MPTSKKVVLHFPLSQVNQPVLCRLVKEYNLDFNILKASVTPKEEGVMVVELTGTKKEYEEGINYLVKAGLRIQPLSQDVVRNESRCTHCGACVVMCPTEALFVNQSTRQVEFDDAKCLACEICVPICPARAMEIHF